MLHQMSYRITPLAQELAALVLGLCDCLARDLRPRCGQLRLAQVFFPTSRAAYIFSSALLNTPHTKPCTALV